MIFQLKRRSSSAFRSLKSLHCCNRWRPCLTLFFLALNHVKCYPCRICSKMLLQRSDEHRRRSATVVNWNSSVLCFFPSTSSPVSPLLIIMNEVTFPPSLRHSATLNLSPPLLSRFHSRALPPRRSSALSVW